MKEKFTGALGIFGYIIWFLISYLLVFFPLVFIGLPWWANILIVFAIQALPLLGAVAEIVIWIWGVVIAVQMPQSVWTILLYVAFAVNVIVYVIPTLYSFISSFFQKD